ncbi:MAG: ATP cone domain-containing protein [Candidatus Nanoarchaeia archaeon]|nr:ATP cone domain-containing protein [Candidatus Nanoarchaeia archaeon]MDD5357949.1 ATP cone domain-containing protein [Candidatus Nanoarchaeia archaeon]MDD5588868.1 ATP cone domain-containing protein [Candidatus Nanoarchaeia archaeon]
MTHVIKRGGQRKQAFSPSKIKKAIKGAVKEAGFSPRKTEEVVNEVGNEVVNFFGKKKVVKSVDIRKSILGRLERRSKSAAAAWKRFEKRKQGKF